jgi:hypothetical protein
MHVDIARDVIGLPAVAIGLVAAQFVEGEARLAVASSDVQDCPADIDAILE